MYAFTPYFSISTSRFTPSSSSSPCFPVAARTFRPFNPPPSASLLVTNPVDALPDATKSLIRSSVPLLSDHSVEIGSLFYETMFSSYPGYKQQFTLDRQAGGSIQENGAPAQIVAVTRAMINFGKNIDDLSKLSRSMDAIFHKHVSRGVTAEQYPAVGESFLKAAKEVLGEEMTDEIAEAWKEAYGALAEIYVEKERVLKKELEDMAGYEGFKQFEVGKIEEKKNSRVLFLKENELGNGVLEGMYVGIKAGEEGGMVNGKIVGTEEGGMSVEVKYGKGKAAIYFRENVEVGKKLIVSVPCGKGKN